MLEMHVQNETSTVKLPRAASKKGGQTHTGEKGTGAVAPHHNFSFSNVFCWEDNKSVH